MSLLVACQEKASGTAEITVSVLGSNITFEEEFDGDTLLLAIEDNVRIDTSFGLIKCINSVCNNDEFVWYVEINDQLINYAPGKYYLQDGDGVEIVYGSI